MRTSVLLSIKPTFAEAILEGTKRFEFRRSLFKRPIDKVLLYASSPVQRVIGEFLVAEVLVMRLDRLWSETARYAGIDRRYFDAYFRGLQLGLAIKVKATTRYRTPLDLKAHLRIQYPPQSFCYLT